LAVVIALSDVSTVFDRFVWWLHFTVQRTIIEIRSGKEQFPSRFESLGQIAHEFAVVENMLDHLCTDDNVESVSEITTLVERPKILKLKGHVRVRVSTLAVL
jgi:hypothetical protein